MLLLNSEESGMKKRTLKLGLSRETLRAMDPSEAVDVAGASHPASRCATCGSKVMCCVTVGGVATSCPCA